jgi:hypothetical protein
MVEMRGVRPPKPKWPAFWAGLAGVFLICSGLSTLAWLLAFGASREGIPDWGPPFLGYALLCLILRKLSQP